jgi:N6-adenosine-specific RNA methylase IME4
MSAPVQYQLFPVLTPSEFAELKADIAQRGDVLVPIELDEHGNILDGHHRVRAWQELRAEGVVLRDYPSITRGGLTEVEKHAHIRAINILRRHLTGAQKRAVIADQLKETPEKSDPLIAEALGVSSNTVADVRDELESTSQIEKLDHRVGKDGKSRPAVFNRTRRDERQTQAALKDIGDNVTSNTVMTTTEVTRAAREHRREQARDENAALANRAASIATIGQTFSTIVLDPPWDWGDEGDVDQMGRARPTYDTMSLDEIAALEVAERAKPNAHIYLWITNRSLPKGFALLEQWGFRYVTMLTWVKPSFGMGNYFRGQTEHVLFGVRGSLALLRHDRGTVITAPREGDHSTKPTAFYDLVQECSPGPWLEMFARRPRDGFVVWGNEVAA